MDLNGVSSYSQIDAYSAYQKDAANTAPAAAKSDDTAVVYEKSEAATKYKAPIPAPSIHLINLVSCRL